MARKRNAAGSFGVMVLGLVLSWAGTGAAARADNLNEALLKEAHAIIEAIQAKGHKNVGVLHFRASLGAQKDNFAAGAINANLAARLENALIVKLNPGKPELNVLHDASLEAASRGVVKWFKNKNQRARLFQFDDYPRAWGNVRVKPDVFLTGEVKMFANSREARVKIEMFSEDELDLIEICKEPLKVAADFSLLRDLGLSYSLPRDILRDKVEPAHLVRNLIVPGEDQEAAPKQLDRLQLDDVVFQMLVNGKAVPFQEDRGKSCTVKCPGENDQVVFVLENKGKDRVGVDVRVNGFSLVFEQTTAPEDSKIWLLDPDARFKVGGWYKRVFDRGDNFEVRYEPFKIVVGAEEARLRASLDEQAGEIRVSVFKQAGPAANGGQVPVGTGIPAGPAANGGQAPDGAGITRGLLLRPSIDQNPGRGARSDLATLQTQIRQEAYPEKDPGKARQDDPFNTRGLLAPNEEQAKADTLTKDVFHRSKPAVASRVIRLQSGKDTSGE